jgi:aldehyde dehydrogenase
MPRWRNGAARLNSAQVERLTQAAFTFPAGQGAGCAKPSINRDVLGRDATVLARLAGIDRSGRHRVAVRRDRCDHLFVEEEQMMPFLPIVRVKSVEEGIAALKKAEHNYKHTAIIHSHDVETMTAMAKALDTTLFVKNGASWLAWATAAKATELFHCHRDRRRHHQSAHLHARPPLRDGG